MDVNELREVGHEPAGDEVLDHELDEARRRLHTLESHKEERQSQLQTRPMRALPLQRPKAQRIKDARLADAREPQARDRGRTTYGNAITYPCEELVGLHRLPPRHQLHAAAAYHEAAVIVHAVARGG